MIAWIIMMNKQGNARTERSTHMSTHPLSVTITTRDSTAGRDVQQQYIVQTKHPRWELLKIFVHALTHLEFR